MTKMSIHASETALDAVIAHATKMKAELGKPGLTPGGWLLLIQTLVGLLGPLLGGLGGIFGGGGTTPPGAGTGS
jgi:hypothetical protein